MIATICLSQDSLRCFDSIQIQKIAVVLKERETYKKLYEETDSVSNLRLSVIHDRNDDINDLNKQKSILNIKSNLKDEIIDVNNFRIKDLRSNNTKNNILLYTFGGLTLLEALTIVALLLKP